MKRQIVRIFSILFCILVVTITLSIVSRSLHIETFDEKKEAIRNHILNIEAIEDVDRYDYNEDGRITISDYTILRINELKKKGKI